MPIMNMVGGGRSGKSPTAFITVTYPAGSTVTCTNSIDSKKLSSTQEIFYVYNDTLPFNSVITATNGVYTRSRTVSVVFDGQSSSVTIEYRRDLFINGAVAEGFTWHSQNVMGKISDGAITLSTDGSNSCVCGIGDVDVTNFSTLYAVVNQTGTNGGQAQYAVRFGLVTSYPSGNATSNNKSRINPYYDLNNGGAVSGTFSVDISSVEGIYKFCVSCNARGTITSVYLE